MASKIRNPRENNDEQLDLFSSPALSPTASAAFDAAMKDAEPAQAESRAEPKSAAAPLAALSGEKLEDVGDSLWGNRKSILANGISWSDIQDENETLRLKLATKSKIWPRPDWEKLLADVSDDADGKAATITAYLVKTIYDSISTKPTGITADKIELYVDTVQEVRAAAETLLSNQEMQREFMRGVGALAEKRMGGASRAFTISSLAADQTIDELYVPLRHIWHTVFPLVSGDKSFRQAPQENDKALQLSRKSIKAMQLSINDVITAMTEIEGGWPAKKPLWMQRGYKVKQVPADAEAYVARSLTEKEGFSGFRPAIKVKDASSTTTTFLDALPAGSTAEDALSFAQKHADGIRGKWYVTKKSRVIATYYETRELAESAAKEAAAPARRARPSSVIPKDNSPWMRTGVLRREPGTLISPDDLMEKFGLRGVNFGNWVNQKERQDFMNSAHDALCDLADVLKIESTSIGLGGLLGLAFGAQGHGGVAAAHFIPGVNEINLTKNAGAGSLAHEWGHALDHLIGISAGLAVSTEPFASWLGTYSTRVRAAIEGENRFIAPAVKDTMLEFYKASTQAMESDETAALRTEKRLCTAKALLGSMISNSRLHEKLAGQPEALEALAEIENGVTGEYKDWPAPAGRKRSPGSVNNNVHTAMTAANMSYTDASNLSLLLFSYSSAKEEAKDPKPREVQTQYLKRSKDLDGGRKDSYWSTPHEMFARAFESWVFDRLDEKEVRSDFLVRKNKDPASVSVEASSFPYPLGDERKAINDVFDSLVDHRELWVPEQRRSLKRNDPEMSM